MPLRGGSFPGRIAEDRSVLEAPQSDSIGAPLALIHARRLLLGEFWMKG
ncbi:hypothetical protein PSPO01_14098 [Paraphaeosphaeria sporulosa]